MMLSQTCTCFQSARIARPARQTAVSPLNAVQAKDLPYALDALEPKISKATNEYHWGKHYKTYVTNLNKQIEGKPLDSKSLEEMVLATWNNGSQTPEFNNAAQVWNHEFYWEGMSPNGGGSPKGEVAKQIDAAFGSFDKFKEEFGAAGATQFGSGWAWLVKTADGKVAVTKTPNAQTPLHNQGETPLLTMDVWEHAYYLDEQNKRPSYISTFVNELIDWDKVEQRYQSA